MKLEDYNITIFDNVTDTNGRIATLAEFLSTPSQLNRDIIDVIRSSQNNPELQRKLKKRLPQATISGVFEGGRRLANLKKHSGLICIDIDYDDNVIYNLDKKVEAITKKFDSVLYASKSVSGRGYFLIIPIAYPERHKEHFLALRQLFDHNGINIDRACSDVTRLRCLSYDPDAFYNPDAVPYEPFLVPMPKPMPKALYGLDKYENREDRVARVCEHIASRGINITRYFDDWIALGYSLASLGERGREFYHIISRQDARYDPKETDSKFDCMLDSNIRSSLGTFFYICGKFGAK